jgi:hypothetical protein
MTDTLTMPGANALAQQIRDYWAKQGKKVRTEVIVARSPKQGGDMKGELHCIRSDMLNGMPRNKP